MLIAVVLASVAAWLLHLPVETIGSRFGQLPDGLPGPRLPDISYATVLEVLPTALSFTLLGAVESLLSAKVADGMTGRKHRYNMEVVAQGIANIASAMFGGISVTGTIARTATNIRAGACSPVSGMAHALFVLVFMVLGARLASFVPLSALAGVLVVVCWNMAEKEEFSRLLHDWRPACVLIATFGLTLVEDLTVGIIAGCGLAAAFAIYDRIVHVASTASRRGCGWQHRRCGPINPVTFRHPWRWPRNRLYRWFCKRRRARHCFSRRRFAWLERTLRLRRLVSTRSVLSGTRRGRRCRARPALRNVRSVVAMPASLPRGRTASGGRDRRCGGRDNHGSV